MGIRKKIIVSLWAVYVLVALTWTAYGQVWLTADSVQAFETSAPTPYAWVFPGPENDQTLTDYQAQVRKRFHETLVTVFLIWPIALMSLILIAKWPSQFYRDHVPPASARDLGGIRAVVFAIIFTNILWEDVACASVVPAHIRCEMGIMKWLNSIPGWAQLYTNYSLLVALKVSCLFFCFLALIGYRTRWVMPVATLLALLIGGILREFTGYFHSGLMPLYLALLLCLMPSGNGLSLDRLAGRTRERASHTYGWCRYYCWITIASAYFFAALSKIWEEGYYWWKGRNLKKFVLTDTLNPMQFEWGLDDVLVQIPESCYAVLGLAALVLEFTFFLVLFFRWARLIYPIAAFGMHLGIWITQGVLFFDMMLLQIIFYSWVTPLLEYRYQKWHPNQPLPVVPPPTPKRYLHWLWLPGGLILAGGLSSVWIFDWEEYPATTWPMYSYVGDCDMVFYHQLFSIHENGDVRPIYPEKYLGLLADGRYRKTWNNPKQEVLLFQTVVRQYNRRHPNDKIKAIEIRCYEWPISSPKKNGIYGKCYLTQQYKLPLPDSKSAK